MEVAIDHTEELTSFRSSMPRTKLCWKSFPGSVHSSSVEVPLRAAENGLVTGEVTIQYGRTLGASEAFANP